MSMCLSCVCLYLQEDIRPSGAGVAGDCEPSAVGLGTELRLAGRSGMSS